MFFRMVRRRLRRSCFLDVVYLSLFVSGLFFLSSQLSNSISDAKAIPPFDREDIGVQRQEDAVEQEAAPKAIIERREEPRRTPQMVKPVIRQDEAQPVVKAPQVHRIGGAYGPDTAGGVSIPVRNKEPRYINGERYPQLNSEGKFIPMRRIVHLDLKGAPYKPSVFVEIFSLLNRLKATGVMIEWEDMFPYTGKLAGAVNGNAYSIQEVHQILAEAKRHHLQIIPLVQTFGHLEWVLKLKEYAYLRDDPKYPQVICVGKEEAWSLIKEMIEQVGQAHAKYGLEFFHIGSDEVFQVGVCNETVAEMRKHENLRERLMMWHIARTAKYTKDKFNTTVLAWHDMLVHATSADLVTYKLPQLIEPVLWSYAEDLDQYLPQSTWAALTPFGRVWGSSAWKGADGPMRHDSNPTHYIKNHESWISQFTNNYQQFDVVQGLFFAGWSRYDHMAILCETFPIGLPTLAMSMETMLVGRPLRGYYPSTTAVLHCTPPVETSSYVYGCQFPGRKVYELVNELTSQRRQLKKYQETDFEMNGWLSNHADKYQFSSPMYIQKIRPFIDYYAQPLERLVKDLRTEMSAIFFDDAVDEFIETYLQEDLDWVRQKTKTARAIMERTEFQKRPFVDHKDL